MEKDFPTVQMIKKYCGKHCCRDCEIRHQCVVNCANNII